jgi:DNA-binding SARP family transcriptional activator
VEMAEVPTSARDTAAPVRLGVLGPVTLATQTGPISTGIRNSSRAILAILAAHPPGRTLDQIITDLHPDLDPSIAAKRVRTGITAARKVLRDATHDQGMFIQYEPATGRYRIDPDLIEVDLWQMLAAIHRANHADDDTTCLTALQEAASQYQGDFAADQDPAWITDYATTHRHHILNVYARIAEILEPDHPDQAVTALEHAINHDPINEELYQRIIRIHGRQHRPDAVRRTLTLLENRLADLGDDEPSETTRRIAHRQLDAAAAHP